MSVVKPFIGEWRACHNPECERSYTVEHPTHYHCSDACAAVCLARRIKRPSLVLAEIVEG